MIVQTKNKNSNDFIFFACISVYSDSIVNKAKC